MLIFFFFQHKTAYDMRISDWSSDVCSSVLVSADSLSLLKVGDLARRTGKTVRAIHLYEELGLLTPAVRSKGGFRMYSGLAVKRINWIQKRSEERREGNECVSKCRSRWQAVH